MIIYLAYKRLDHSAKILTDEELGTQRVHVYQTMKALVRKQVVNDIRGGLIPWAEHPTVLMWQGYEWLLTKYSEALTLEWVKRGYVDTLHSKIEALYNKLPSTVGIVPKWLGIKKLHSSHRSNLLHKSNEYQKWGWSEEPEESVWWPPVRRKR